MSMWTKADPNASTRHAAGVVVEQRQDGKLYVRCNGSWVTRTVELVDPAMREAEQVRKIKTLELDLSEIDQMDTAGAWLVQRLVVKHENQGARITVRGASKSNSILMKAVADAASADRSGAKRGGSGLLTGFLEKIGRLTVDFYTEFLMGMHILGATIRGAQLKAGRRHTLRPAAIVHQMDRMGVGALPVVVLMSAIIGAIIAQQGAFQLRYFGAEIFVVDLVAVLVLREIGVLLTAIMIAGRSGSAITAEIGSMKMREEVDALTVIGLNPIGVLVFPRLVALVIMLPCLTIAANAAALLGAMAVAWSYSDITPIAFIERMHAWIDLTTIFAGMIKAPFMAIIIGVIASIEGLKTEGSAESLGRHVTASVVKSIFVVILEDGLFAMFYAAIDF